MSLLECVRMFDYLRAARAYLIPEQDNIFLHEGISANPLLKYSTVDKIHLGQEEKPTTPINTQLIMQTGHILLGTTNGPRGRHR